MEINKTLLMIYLIYYSLKILSSRFNMNYFLSEKDIASINEWKQTSNKLLMISGDDSVGKTSLAYELYDNRDIIHINSEMIKNNTHMGDYIKNIVNKKSIQMMYKEPSFLKNVIIDDLEVFNKHDKLNYKHIINILNLGKYKLIVIFHTSLIKNKYIQQLLKKHYHIMIKYSEEQITTIINEWLLLSSKKISTSTLHDIMYKSKYNIRNIKILLNSEIELESSYINKKYDYETIIHKLLSDSGMSVTDIIQIVSHDYSTILLNLLENLMNYIHTNHIASIYGQYSYMDIIDTFSVSNHKWYDFYEYCIILSIVYLYNIIHSYHHKIIVKNIIYNKYISKSLISIHIEKMYNLKMGTSKNVPIYIILSSLLVDKNNHINIDSNISNKYIEAHIKSLNWLYDEKLKKSDIHKLLKTK